MQNKILPCYYDNPSSWFFYHLDKQLAMSQIPMHYITRLVQKNIEQALSHSKSVLLLGPRQTGKTTLSKQQITSDLVYSFLDAGLRRRFESNPEILIGEIKAYRKLNSANAAPTVIIDEVQKVPIIMDTIQYAIDDKLANFILTGSSAKKLKNKHGRYDVNLLPGRVVNLHLDALSLLELPSPIAKIEDLLLHGCLPEIVLQDNIIFKEKLLSSYVNIYLEDEVRAEAYVRDLAKFNNFLAFAAIEAGNEINASKLSQEIGVSRHIINQYFQVLLDSLIVERIDPVTDLNTRRRLAKAPKYLFFDLGVRRIAAGEGTRMPRKYYGKLFEQFIGMELIKLMRIDIPQAKLKYWHDHSGPEVDYVIEFNHKYIPIEVKYTALPNIKDATHLIKFLQEYDCYEPAYVVCQTPQPMQLAENIIAINWEMLPAIITKAKDSY